MKNFVQPGESLSLTAPYNVSSGGGMLVGSIFGVVSTDITTGNDVEVVLEGVFTLNKVSAQAWTQGQLIYWDDVAKLCTTVSAGNKLVGAAAAIAANPTSTGVVRLNNAYIS